MCIPTWKRLQACRSQAALTYEEAQVRIDDLRLQDEISRNLRTMNAAAKVALCPVSPTPRGILTLNPCPCFCLGFSVAVRVEMDRDCLDLPAIALSLVLVSASL